MFFFLIFILNPKYIFRPYIGLAIPLLLFQERYEQVLSLLDIPTPQVHPAITKALSEQIFFARCEALYGIHDDNALAQLHLLSTDSSGSKGVPTKIRLAVRIWVEFLRVLII